MTSTAAPSRPAPKVPHQHLAQPSSGVPQSPPSKRDLQSWWKPFQVQSKYQEAQETRPPGIFGVPLRQSITYANVAVSLVDNDGKSSTYGYIPIVVAKCGVFLKEKATGVEGIFRLSGSEKRIKKMKQAFDSPERYGKDLAWDGYTVHDAANVLRRYLNDLPEPVVPLDLYERFRQPLRGHAKQLVGDVEGVQLANHFNEAEAVAKYQELIKILPPLNRQLLLYVLDLLATFAAKAHENRMTAQNLAAIFQPGMLSHPHHAMALEEYRFNQCVIIFFIKNQDHFLIGMECTAAHLKTKQVIETGTPVIGTPTVTPNGTLRYGSIRTTLKARAGPEGVSPCGQTRRNCSVLSRHSHQCNGVSIPGRPALATTRIAASGGVDLGWSSSVISKGSLHILPNHFQRQEQYGSPPAVQASISPSPLDHKSTHLFVDGTPAKSTNELSIVSRASAQESSLTPSSSGTAHPRNEMLLNPSLVGRLEAITPVKDRNNQNLFSLSRPNAAKMRPNNVRKKRIPSMANSIEQSSTASSTRSGAVRHAHKSSNPVDKCTCIEPMVPEHAPPELSTESLLTMSTSSNAIMQATQPTHPPSRTLLHSSVNEDSNLEHNDDNASNYGLYQEKERKRHWRLSPRRKKVFALLFFPFQEMLS